MEIYTQWKLKGVNVGKLFYPSPFAAFHPRISILKNQNSHFVLRLAHVHVHKLSTIMIHPNW